MFSTPDATYLLAGLQELVHGHHPILIPVHFLQAMPLVSVCPTRDNPCPKLKDMAVGGLPHISMSPVPYPTSWAHTVPSSATFPADLSPVCPQVLPKAS